MEYYLPEVIDGEVCAGKLKGSVSFIGCTVEVVNSTHPEYALFSDRSVKDSENFGLIVKSPKKTLRTFYFKVVELFQY